MRTLIAIMILLAPCFAQRGTGLYRTQVGGYLTYRGDNTHQGQNTAETQLTTANVTATHFEKAWAFTTADGQVYTQPIIAHNLVIGGVVRDVVYFATENDTAYALDASTGTQLWSASLRAGESAASQTDVASCNDITPSIGVQGTPVIDPGLGTIYFVAKTEVAGPTFKFRLHALNLLNGSEQSGSPVLITATVAGTGAGSSGGNISLDPHHNNNKGSLTLLNGIVYIGFSSHCDDTPYHGWVIGYDSSSLTQRYAWANAPNSGTSTSAEGAVWMGGSGPSVDSQGNLYVVTGNGDFNGTDAFGESVVKFSKSLAVLDYFTPNDAANMNTNDWDLGSSGITILPDQSGNTLHEAVLGGKEVNLWVVNRDNLGHQGASGDPQIPQFLANATGSTNSGDSGMFTSPTYWNGHMYFCPDPDGGTTDQGCHIRNLTNGQLGSKASSTTQTFEERGGISVVSSNGTSNGILWVARNDGTAGREHLYAYDATNLATLLWDSEANSARDSSGMTGSKFVPPAVFNGRVFIAGQSGIAAYVNF